MKKNICLVISCLTLAISATALAEETNCMVNVSVDSQKVAAHHAVSFNIVGTHQRTYSLTPIMPGDLKTEHVSCDQYIIGATEYGINSENFKAANSLTEKLENYVGQCNYRGNPVWLQEGGSISVTYPQDFDCQTAK